MGNDATTIVIKAKDETAAAFTSVQAGISKFASSYAMFTGVVGGGGILAGLAATVKASINLGDEMNDLSQKVGIGVQNLATWTLAANQSGTSIESVAKGVKGLSQFMVANSNELQKNGITAKDANGALIQLADLFKALPDGVQKTALAVKIFGKSGMDMIPMLNQGSDGLQEAADKAKLYGERLALLAPMADKFNDQLSELALQSKVAGINLALTVAGPMTQWLAANNEAIHIAGSAAEAARLFVFNLDAMTSEKPRQEIERLTKALQDWQTASSFGKFMTKPLFSSYEGREGDLKKQIELLKFLERQDALAGAAKLGDIRDARDRTLADAGTMGSAEAQAKAARLLGKEGNDRESVYLANLRQQLNVVSGDTSESSKQLLAITVGAAKDFSQSTKDSALSLAWQVDVQKQATKESDVLSKSLKHLDSTNLETSKSVDVFVLKNIESIRSLQAESEMIGMNAEEHAKANNAKQSEIELDRAILDQREKYRAFVQAQQTIIDTSADAGERVTATNMIAAAQAQQSRNIQTLIDKSKEEKSQWNDTYDSMIGKANAWSTGVKTAANSYLESITPALQANQLVNDSIRGMEDAVVSFAKTGKLNFSSLADSVITDMIRIEIQTEITGPFAKTLKGSDGGGGIFDIIGSKILNWTGFATGGDFVVGGKGGTDTTPVAFMATPGETVSIRTPGQRTAAGDTYYIDATGADPAGIARLERTIVALNGSIERRAVAAALNSRRREPLAWGA